MPWTIETKAPDCKGFAVVNATGKTVGCHTSRKDALAHQRALYVNVKDVTQKDDPTVSDVHVDTIMSPVRIRKPKLAKSVDSLITQHDKLHTMTDQPNDAQLYVHHALMDAIDKAGQDVNCSCGVWSEPLLLNSVSTTFDALAKSDNPSLSPVSSIIQSGIDQGYKFADVLHMLDVGGYMMVVRPKIIDAPQPAKTPTEPTQDVEMNKSFIDRFKNLLKEIGLPSLDGTVVGGGTTTLTGKVTTVYKANEQRFTLGPWYIPDQQDAHGEWTDSQELQQGLWDYVKSGDRKIRLQHNKNVIAGEWVETMTWPYSVQVPMQKADGSSQDATYPAGTVFMGVIWEPWAWDLVKAGKLTGYSIGGKSERMMVDLPDATPDQMAKHLAGKHDQRTHGRGGGGATVGGQPRAGMGDIKITDEMAAEMQGGSAAPFLVKDAQGNWAFTPERQAMHDSIVKKSVDGVPSSANPTYVVMGGGPAAGKSTILESGGVKLPPHTVEVNSDHVKTQLPEWGTSGKNAASVTHAESSYIAKRTQSAAFERKQNIVLDGTGDTSPKSMTGKIDTAHAAGYKVEAHYVTLPTELAIQNAAARAAQTGRHVPEEVIRTTHAGVSTTFPSVATKFDSVKLYDTTVRGKARVIAEGGAGVLNVVDKVAYDGFLAKGKP